jgi:AraC-like DNA-binding protein
MVEDLKKSDLPHEVLDVQSLREDERFDFWRESVRPFFSTEPTKGAPNHTVSGKSTLVDSLIYINAEFGSFTTSRGKVEINSSDSEYLVLETYSFGGVDGVFGGEHYSMRPGSLYLRDWQKPFRDQTLPSSVRSLVIPYSALGYDPSLHNAHFAISVDSVKGQILMAAFEAFEKQLPFMSQVDAPAVSAGLMGLVRGLFLSNSLSGINKSVENGSIHLVKKYIADNLSNSHLNVDGICKFCALSRSALYRLFENDGGVALYIRESRLKRSYAMFSSPQYRDIQITTIALNLGFSNVTHFNRAFKAKFGVTPSDVKNTCKANLITNNNSAFKQGVKSKPIFHNWLDEIGHR